MISFLMLCFTLFLCRSHSSVAPFVIPAARTKPRTERNHRYFYELCTNCLCLFSRVYFAGDSDSQCSQVFFISSTLAYLPWLIYFPFYPPYRHHTWCHCEPAVVVRNGFVRKPVIRVPTGQHRRTESIDEIVAAAEWFLRYALLSSWVRCLLFVFFKTNRPQYILPSYCNYIFFACNLPSNQTFICSGIIPDSFCGLAMLTDLNISNCCLTGECLFKFISSESVV